MGDELSGVLEHLASCGLCSDLWRLAYEAMPPESTENATAAPFPPLVVTTDTVAVPAGRVARQWLGASAVLAAALMIAVGLGLRQDPGFRDGDSAPDGAPRLLQETLALSAPIVRWSVETGAVCSLTITSPELELLANQKGLTQAEVELDRESVGNVQPGVELPWILECVLTSGDTVSARGFLTTTF